MNKVTVSLILLMALAIGGIGGYYFATTAQSSQRSIENCALKYHFINSRLGCQPLKVIEKREYTELTADLEQLINEKKQSQHVSHVSVYFRDLIAGPTFGIESQERFIPASLLKLPMVITYLSLEEANGDILTKKIPYENVTLNTSQSTYDIPQLEKNKVYTIEELLTRTITYSDNVSEALLRNYLNKQYPSENLLIQTMVDLGLVDPRNPVESTLTVKSYATIFRQLYNSSYLSPEMSEKALTLLAKATYKKGLVAGVPTDMKVAHKFGEREGLRGNEKQLHDCGIIYYPDNPYLLCVMTRGDDMKELENVIKMISEKVYKEVDSRKY